MIHNERAANVIETEYPNTEVKGCYIICRKALGVMSKN